MVVKVDLHFFQQRIQLLAKYVKLQFLSYFVVHFLHF